MFSEVFFVKSRFVIDHHWPISVIESSSLFLSSFLPSGVMCGAPFHQMKWNQIHILHPHSPSSKNDSATKRWRIIHSFLSLCAVICTVKQNVCHGPFNDVMRTKGCPPNVAGKKALLTIGLLTTCLSLNQAGHQGLKPQLEATGLMIGDPQCLGASKKCRPQEDVRRKENRSFIPTVRDDEQNDYTLSKLR